MNVKCSSCGYETQVNATLLKGLIGGTLLSGAALGWTTYAFAGLLGFHGGAALITVTLLAGGGSVAARPLGRHEAIRKSRQGRGKREGSQEALISTDHH